MKSFEVRIVTPEGEALSTQCESLVAPAEDGYLGVLADHAPLMAVVKPGLVTVRAGSETKLFAVGSGFLQVAANRVVILADKVAETASLDPDSLGRAREAILKALAAKQDPERNRVELERLAAWSRLTRHR